MFAIITILVLFLTIFNASNHTIPEADQTSHRSNSTRMSSAEFGRLGQTRRIVNGTKVTTEKRFVVYIIKSNKTSSVVYDEWLCGGAIVTQSFVLTSAACLEDIDHMYVVAGYKKYVKDKDVETNDCTKKMKKKIVYTCVPKHYVLGKENLSVWSNIDIGLAKVETPYDFKDESYAKTCSYTPAPITINFEAKFQVPDIETIVYGWGHEDRWRIPGDFENYNEEDLRYAAAQIMPKPACKKQYEYYINMSYVIDKYMICTHNVGALDENGHLLLEEFPKIEGCGIGDPLKLAMDGDVECTDDETEEDGDSPKVIDQTRREVDNSNKTNNDSGHEPITTDTPDYNIKYNTRRQGICQNDHGGPLVTWIGTREVLIGVASVFRISDDLKCMGPYLYTSTQCTSAFIDCVLSKQEPSWNPPEVPPNITERRSCNLPPAERGFDIVEKYISWKSHPYGAADNEESRNVENIENVTLTTPSV